MKNIFWTQRVIAEVAFEWKRLHCGGFVFCCFSSILMTLSICGNCEASSLELVEKWKKFDQVYLESIYASGTQNSVSPSLPWRGEATEEKIHTSYFWKITQKNKQRCVVLWTSLPSTLEESKGVMPQRISFFEDARRILRKESRLLESVPQGELLTSNNVSHSTLHTLNADSDELSLLMDTPLFALGRGFSQRLGTIDAASITVIQHNDEEICFLKAQGNYSSINGNWEIQFVPSLAYMVRSARFLMGEELIFEIDTFGAKVCNNCIFPEKAEVRIYLTKQHVVTHDVTITEAKLEFDTELFEFVQNDVDSELGKGSLIIDETSGETKAKIVGSSTDFEYALPPRSAFWRYFTIAVVNLIGILILIYLYYCSRRKNKTP